MAVHPKSERSWGRFAALAAGAVCSLLGAWVLAGWAAHWDLLVRVGTGTTAMQPNTAVCFVLCGAGVVLAFRRPRYSRWCGFAALAIAAVTGLEYLARPYTAAVRMAPNTLVLFLLSATALAFGGCAR
jgi:hypothetical protein